MENIHCKINGVCVATMKRKVCLVLCIVGICALVGVVLALVVVRRNIHQPCRLQQASTKYTRRFPPYVNIPARMIGLKRHLKHRGAKTFKRLQQYHPNIQIHYGVHGEDESKKSFEQSEFHRLNLHKLPNVMFTPGEMGCCASHLQCYEEMERNNIPLMFIYEDDVLPMDTQYSVIVEKVLQAVRRRRLDIVFFGHMDPLRKDTGLVVPRWSFCMHAYAVTLHGAKKILNDVRQYGWNEPIDMTLFQEQKRHKCRSGLVNHHHVEGTLQTPVRFRGKRTPNKRSYGCVAQDNDMGTTIKNADKILTWKAW